MASPGCFSVSAKDKDWQGHASSQRQNQGRRRTLPHVPRQRWLAGRPATAATTKSTALFQSLNLPGAWPAWTALWWHVHKLASRKFVSCVGHGSTGSAGKQDLSIMASGML